MHTSRLARSIVRPTEGTAAALMAVPADTTALRARTPGTEWAIIRPNSSASCTVRLDNSADPAGTSKTSTTLTVSAGGGREGRDAAWYTKTLSRPRLGADRVYLGLSASQNAASTCPA